MKIFLFLLGMAALGATACKPRDFNQNEATAQRFNYDKSDKFTNFSCSITKDFVSRNPNSQYFASLSGSLKVNADARPNGKIPAHVVTNIEIQDRSGKILENIREHEFDGNWEASGMFGTITAAPDFPLNPKIGQIKVTLLGTAGAVTQSTLEYLLAGKVIPIPVECSNSSNQQTIVKPAGDGVYSANEERENSVLSLSEILLSFSNPLSQPDNFFIRRMHPSPRYGNPTFRDFYLRLAGKCEGKEFDLQTIGNERWLLCSAVGSKSEKLAKVGAIQKLNYGENDDNVTIAKLIFEKNVELIATPKYRTYDVKVK